MIVDNICFSEVNARDKKFYHTRKVIFRYITVIVIFYLYILDRIENEIYILTLEQTEIKLFKLRFNFKNGY